MCGLPVLQHTNAVKEMIPGPDGTMRMQLYHAKRCWPKLRKRRNKQARQEAKEKKMAANTPPTDPAPPEPVVSKPSLNLVARVTPGEQKRSGLGLAIYRILDSIPENREWTINEIVERLAVHNISTTLGSITQTCYTYKKMRRKTKLVRVVHAPGRTGHVRVFMFEEPAPKTPARRTSVHKKKGKPAMPKRTRERLPDPTDDWPPQPAPTSMQTAPPPVPAKPSLTRADVNRAFNDFQAFLLETLADFRNDILGKIKS